MKRAGKATEVSPQEAAWNQAVELVRQARINAMKAHKRAVADFMAGKRYIVPSLHEVEFEHIEHAIAKALQRATPPRAGARKERG